MLDSNKTLSCNGMHDASMLGDRTPSKQFVYNGRQLHGVS